MNKPEPKPTPETEPFWTGCAQEDLRLQHCDACGHTQFPPRKLCSSCFGEAVSWHSASGRGKVRSWSTVLVPGAPGFEAEVPYIAVLVALDEGPTMLSVLRNCRAEQVDFDMPVEVIFEPRGDTKIPYFQPVEA